MSASQFLKLQFAALIRVCYKTAFTFLLFLREEKKQVQANLKVFVLISGRSIV